MGRDPVEADFLGSALTVRLAVPPESGVQRTSCWIGESDGNGHYPYEWDGANVVDGFATLRYPLLPAGTYSVRLDLDSKQTLGLPPTYDLQSADRITLSRARTRSANSLCRSRPVSKCGCKGAGRLWDSARMELGPT